VLVAALIATLASYLTDQISVWQALQAAVAALAVYSTGVAIEDSGNAVQNDLLQRSAELLAKPFSKDRGRGSAPLSYRSLPEGGMVVITADGRKLWFSAEEVRDAIDSLKQKSPLHPTSSQLPRSRFKPGGLMPRQEAPAAYDGMPSLIVLPPATKKKPSNGETS